MRFFFWFRLGLTSKLTAFSLKMNISEKNKVKCCHISTSTKSRVDFCRCFSLAHFNLSHRFSPPVMAIRQDSWCDTMSLWSISTSWWQLAVPVHLYSLSGGFKCFFIFYPYVGKWSNLTKIFFQVGWFNHQTSNVHPGSPRCDQILPIGRIRNPESMDHPKPTSHDLLGSGFWGYTYSHAWSS